ncbi:hypothetical protein HY948_04060 [Candidatus Gottesmanbacteria bacterium]|nr:hypothetical protein [Candidatus Gottesmanbacteria bacterium]
MNSLLDVILVIWWFRIVANIASCIQLWYIKEYRIDRMLVHLKTEEGKGVLWMDFRRPRISPKTIVLGISCALAVYTLYSSLSIHPLLRLFVIDCLTFPIVSVLVLLFQVPTHLYHEIIIARADAKIRNHAPLVVIGITGSYGKTSIKEFLSVILSSQYRILKTESSKNSAIAVAETVITKLLPDHEMFVVEMAAYKKGEIARIAAMVHPSVAIVGPINAQHQDLFGSMEETVRAKYELVEALPNNQIVVMNADNAYTRSMGEMAARHGKTVWWYTTKNWSIPKTGAIFRAEHIQTDERQIACIISFRREREKIAVQILGEHQAGNIVASIAGAVAAGMKFSDAARAACRIRPFTKTMQPVLGVNGAAFIDDTFNNNPDAALAAIEYLRGRKGRKILVFQPMIELGKYGEASHFDVGRAAGSVCDDILLTNRNYFDSFVGGARSVKASKKVRVLSPSKAAGYIRSRIGPNDTVLFKGKEAERVLGKLI